MPATSRAQGSRSDSSGRGGPSARLAAGPTGSWARARASKTRCHSPADSSATGRSRRRSRSVRPRAPVDHGAVVVGHGPPPASMGGATQPDDFLDRKGRAARHRLARRSRHGGAAHARPLCQSGSPSRYTTPARGRKRRASVRSKVVLPDPFGPSSARTVPASMPRLTSGEHLTTAVAAGQVHRSPGDRGSDSGGSSRPRAQDDQEERAPEDRGQDPYGQLDRGRDGAGQVVGEQQAGWRR